ncbi:MAG: hypothetical protein ACR2MP_10690 [Streptosporangiaceae bacterium]
MPGDYAASLWWPSLTKSMTSQVSSAKARRSHALVAPSWPSYAGTAAVTSPFLSPTLPCHQLTSDYEWTPADY